MKHFFIVLALITTPTQAAEWYVEIGIGLTSDNYSKIYGIPTNSVEITGNLQQQQSTVFPSPLGKAVIGVEGKHGWSVEIEHISSISDPQDEAGLNALWFMKRITF